MNNINLDINTYSTEELENLLKLKTPYSKEDIFEKKKKLQDNIFISNINQIKKEELLIFLDNINNKLTNNLLKVDEKKFNNVKQYDGNHFVIQNQNDKYETVLENNKKINKSIIKRTYTIDSLFRQNYDNKDNKSHNYIMNLPETITKAITMSISSVEIPLTYHNISEENNNNIFKIIVLDTSDTPINTYNIELITGLYESRFTSNNQIKAANIETEINNNIKNVLNSDISNNLEFKVNVQSGFGFFKLSNTSTILNTNKIKIDFNVNNTKSEQECIDNKIYQKLGWQLGFKKNEIIFDSTTPTNANNEALILSAGICYINYPRYLYISIDDFQSSARNYFSIASDSIIAPNIVARINIGSLLEEKTAFKSAATAGDYLYTQKHIREYFGPTDINKLKVQLLDEYGRPLSINNMDWSFIVSFECFYN